MSGIVLVTGVAAPNTWYGCTMQLTNCEQKLSLILTPTLTRRHNTQVSRACAQLKCWGLIGFEVKFPQGNIESFPDCTYFLFCTVERGDQSPELTSNFLLTCSRCPTGTENSRDVVSAMIRSAERKQSTEQNGYMITKSESLCYYIFVKEVWLKLLKLTTAWAELACCDKMWGLTLALTN